MSLPQQNSYTENDYYNLPENIRIELIDGQIRNQEAPNRRHQKILSALHLCIGNYINAKKGSCEVYPAPFAVRLLQDDTTIVEPDISVICDKDKLTDKGCDGAPDWIIEIISPGNPEHDYIYKLQLYVSANVREYWIVDSHKERILVYHLEKTKFELETYTFHDIVKVKIYDDLYINFSDIAESLNI